MYKGAKKYHYRAGLAVEDEAVRSGLLKIRRRMCGCPPCSPPDFNFGQCVLKHVFGSVMPTYRSPKQKPRGTPTQAQVLASSPSRSSRTGCKRSGLPRTTWASRAPIGSPS